MNYSEELVETLGKLKTIIDDIELQRKRLNEKLSSLDKSQIDIEHLLQLGTLDGKGLVKCGSALRNLRIERDAVKTELFVLEHLYKIVNSDNGAFKSKIISLANNTKETYESSQQRKYRIRNVDKDFVLSVVKDEDVLKNLVF